MTVEIHIDEPGAGVKRVTLHANRDEVMMQLSYVDAGSGSVLRHVLLSREQWAVLNAEVEGR